jgi:transposase
MIFEYPTRMICGKEAKIMAYSMDLRRRVVSAAESGQTLASVAKRFSVTWPTVDHWVERHHRGELAPGPMKPTAADEQLMRDAVAAQPGITAKQLMAMLSVKVVESTVCRTLKRLGLSLKRSR